MLEPKIKKCPCCQSEKMTVCRLKGVASVVGMMNRESALFADVCLDCGQIANLYAEHPEKLRGEKI